MQLAGIYWCGWRSSLSSPPQSLHRLPPTMEKKSIKLVLPNEIALTGFAISYEHKEPVAMVCLIMFPCKMVYLPSSRRSRCSSKTPTPAVLLVPGLHPRLMLPSRQRRNRWALRYLSYNPSVYIFIAKSMQKWCKADQEESCCCLKC